MADIASAMTVYLKDESEVEAQSAWRDGATVYVRVTPELCLEFPSAEVDFGKSAISNEPLERRSAAPKTAKPRAPAYAEDVLDRLVVVAGHRRDFIDIFGRGGAGEFEQLLAETFTPTTAERVFKRHLGRRLDHRELSSVVTWFRTPVGAKVVEADSILDFNRKEKTLTYAGMDSLPEIKRRMIVVGEIEDIVRASELESKVTRNMIQRLINIIPPDFPDAKEIKERIKEEMPTIGKTRKKTIESAAYSYRNLSMTELREYLRFLHTPTGRKYSAAVREATEEIFKKVALTMERAFRKEVNALK